MAAAAAALEQARAIVPSGSVDHTRLVLQLGDLMYDRWKRWGNDLATLNEAIPLVESALTGMQPAGTEWAFTCYLLSTALGDRGVVTGRVDDLARAEQLLDDLAGHDLPGFDASLAAMVAKARGLVAAYRGRDAGRTTQIFAPPGSQPERGGNAGGHDTASRPHSPPKTARST